MAQEIGHTSCSERKRGFDAGCEALEIDVYPIDKKNRIVPQFSQILRPNSSFSPGLSADFAFSPK